MKHPKFNTHKNAQIFIEDNDKKCVAYLDNYKKIYNPAGADLLAFGLFENSTAKRLRFNLLLWIENYLKEKI